MAKMTIELSEKDLKGLVARFIDGGGFGTLVKTRGVPVTVVFLVNGANGSPGHERPEVWAHIVVDDAQPGHRPGAGEAEAPRLDRESDKK